ncbi:MAG: hypothetical protein AMXMBFR67_20060 [Nitrospira sp.]
MANKAEKMQRFIRYYKEHMGVSEVDMREVARFAEKNGWTMPEPVSPIDRLARQFTNAAREEVRYDKKTGRPYRANHAIKDQKKAGGEQTYLWIDIDEASRPKMLKSLVLRREQMVGDAYHLKLDQDHWNSIHPDEDQIDLPLDFKDDVNWRMNGPSEQAS